MRWIGHAAINSVLIDIMLHVIVYYACDSVLYCVYCVNYVCYLSNSVLSIMCRGHCRTVTGRRNDSSSRFSSTLFFVNLRKWHDWWDYKFSLLIFFFSYSTLSYVLKAGVLFRWIRGEILSNKTNILDHYQLK